MLGPHRSSADTDDQFDIMFVDRASPYYEFSKNILRPPRTWFVFYKLRLNYIKLVHD